MPTSLISVLSATPMTGKIISKNVQYQYGSQILFSYLAIKMLNHLNAEYGETLGFFTVVII
jgi:hypothetical protein